MLELKDDQVIVAQATAQGAGAIAMIRVSGNRAVQVVDEIAQLPSHKKLVDQATHTIHYGWIINDQGAHIDQVLFLLMRGPKTFTGQDVVEITCHNNQFLVEQIIQRLLQAGARLGERGEFTRRAVLTGKMDLLQAEAINELIHAQTAQALQLSLSQLEGSLSSYITRFEKQLLHIIAYCEASFEFLDEEMSFHAQIQTKLEELLQDLATLLRSFDKRDYITQGIRIALIGSVNAGKSSLFNALIEKKRAIVTDIAGTTRDTIEAQLYRDQAFMTFVDTAGIRQSQDVVEQFGIDRSFQEAHGADIILLVFDACGNHTQQDLVMYRDIFAKYQDKTIVVQNKIDAGECNLQEIPTEVYIPVSALQMHNIDTLKAVIDAKIQQLLGSGQSSYILNKRQFDLLSVLYQDIQKIEQSIAKKIDYELVAVAVTDALTRLSELTGKTVSENALDAIFQEFCVGK